MLSSSLQYSGNNTITIAYQQMKYLYLLGASLGYFFHRNFNLSVGVFHIIKCPHQWLWDEHVLVQGLLSWNKRDSRNLVIWGIKEYTQGVNIGSAVVDDANRSCSTVWIRVHLQEWKRLKWMDLIPTGYYWQTKEWICKLKLQTEYWITNSTSLSAKSL